jgi:peptidoglycan/xylan/chitin deacetylase (PgdA/CDA1 family)
LVHKIVTDLDEFATMAQLAIGERKGSLVTLYFHHLYADEAEMADPPNLPQERITVSGFRALLEQFHLAGYHFATPAEILRGLEPRRKHLLITFDDGYADNLRALAVLEHFNATATVFISAHHLRDQKAFWTDVVWRQRRAEGVSEREIGQEIDQIIRRHKEQSEHHVQGLFGMETFRRTDGTSRMLNFAELKEMTASGRFFVGNHTCRHVPLSLCDREVARKEIFEAQTILADLSGQLPSTIAYPYGLYDPMIGSIASEAGLKLGFTTVPCKVYRQAMASAGRRMALGRFFPVGVGGKTLARQARYFRSDIMLNHHYQSLKNRLKAVLVGHQM